MTDGTDSVHIHQCQYCNKVFISELAHRGHKASCPERLADESADRERSEDPDEALTRHQ